MTISELPPRLATLGDELERAIRYELHPAGMPSPKRRLRLATTRHRALAALLATTATAAAVIAALLLTAGAAPTVAQAFPILTTKTTDLRGTSQSSGRFSIEPAAFADAHAFQEPYGTGYVVQSQSPNGSFLCVLVPGLASAIEPSRPSLLGCEAPQSLEQGGRLFVFTGPNGAQDAFVALVPTGGSLSVTVDGATTTVPVSGGLATGEIEQSETLTLQVGSSSMVKQLAPNSPPTLTQEKTPTGSTETGDHEEAS